MQCCACASLLSKKAAVAMCRGVAQALQSCLMSTGHGTKSSLFGLQPQIRTSAKAENMIALSQRSSCQGRNEIPATQRALVSSAPLGALVHFLAGTSAPQKHIAPSFFLERAMYLKLHVQRYCGYCCFLDPILHLGDGKPPWGPFFDPRWMGNPFE